MSKVVPGDMIERTNDSGQHEVGEVVSVFMESSRSEVCMIKWPSEETAVTYPLVYFDSSAW